MPDDPASWARPRVASGAMFQDESGRVLLVRPTYKPYWDLPGGYLNAGETPSEACIREVREELGLTIIPNGLLVVDWAPHPAEGDKLLFVFDAGQLASAAVDALELQGEELSEAKFVDSTQLLEHVPPRLSRRLLAAITARATRTVTYLEHGEPTAPTHGARPA